MEGIFGWPERVAKTLSVNYAFRFSGLVAALTAAAFGCRQRALHLPGRPLWQAITPWSPAAFPITLSIPSSFLLPSSFLATSRPSGLGRTPLSPVPSPAGPRPAERYDRAGQKNAAPATTDCYSLEVSAAPLVNYLSVGLPSVMTKDFANNII